MNSTAPTVRTPNSFATAKWPHNTDALCAVWVVPGTMKFMVCDPQFLTLRDELFAFMGTASLDDTDVPAAAQMLAYTRAHRDALSRHSTGGAHVTVSAMLVSPDRRHTLLTLHPKFSRWMQLGGHFEPEDESIAAALRRECVEESGITGLDPDPVLLGVGAFPDINCPKGSRSTHFDVRFVVYANTSDFIVSDESLDLQWWPLDALPQPHDDDLALLAHQTRARITLQDR